MTIIWIFLKEELIQLIVYNFKRGEFADRISGKGFGDLNLIHVYCFNSCDFKGD
jgi:hypothetical protein